MIFVSQLNHSRFPCVAKGLFSFYHPLILPMSPFLSRLISYTVIANSWKYRHMQKESYRIAHQAKYPLTPMQTLQCLQACSSKQYFLCTICLYYFFLKDNRIKRLYRYNLVKKLVIELQAGVSFKIIDVIFL